MEEGGSLGARGAPQPVATVGTKPFWEQPFLGLSVDGIVKVTQWPVISCISEDVWDSAKALCCAQLLHFQGALEIR